MPKMNHNLNAPLLSSFLQGVLTAIGITICCGLYAQAPVKKLQVYAAPAGVPLAEEYQLFAKEKTSTQWQQVPLYLQQSPIDSQVSTCYTILGMQGPVDFRVDVLRKSVRSSTIRPKVFGVQALQRGQSLFFTLPRPMKVSVELNDNDRDAILIFASGPAVFPADTAGKQIVRFGPGLHHIGHRYPLKSNTIYWLDGGAYLSGSFYAAGSTQGIIIGGHGVVDAGYQVWQHPLKGLLCNVHFEDAGSLVMTGITMVNAGNFQLKIQCKTANQTIRLTNLNLIGWNHNTDGIHVSDMDWKDHPKLGNAPGTRLIIDSCFIRANDDAVLLSDGIAAAEVKNSVFWDDGGGAVFCLSWGGHQQSTSTIVQQCFVIHKKRDNPVFRALHAGQADISNVLFENIWIEGQVSTLVGLRIGPHKYDPDPGFGRLNNIIFKNITVEGNVANNWLEGWNDSHRIEGVVFDNLQINGQRITSGQQMHLRTNAHVGPIIFK